jgi:hypothetical protein
VFRAGERKKRKGLGKLRDKRDKRRPNKQPTVKGQKSDGRSNNGFKRNKAWGDGRRRKNTSGDDKVGHSQPERLRLVWQDVLLPAVEGKNGVSDDA